MSIAIHSFVPTASVAATMIGSTNLAAFKLKSAPKVPRSDITPALFVLLAADLVRVTSAFPAVISTRAYA